MSEPYLGQISIFAFNFAPQGWALANGQLLPISQNQALFSLLGTTYGGNGTTTFALPNLQGASPMHFGNGYVQGQTAGEVNHTLIASEMPQHTHVANAYAGEGDQGTPVANLWAESTNAYSSATSVTMNAGAIASAGGSQPHSNMPPYLVVNFAIALQGIFPSRN